MKTRFFFGFTLTLALLVSSALLFAKSLHFADPPVIVGKVKWMTSKNFPIELRKYSRTMASAVAGWQQIVAENPQATMKRGHYRRFPMVVPPHFAVKVTVFQTRTHDLGPEVWWVVLSKADIDGEGPNAPKMLQIVGNEWKLISHWEARDPFIAKHVIATGTVPHR